MRGTIHRLALVTILLVLEGCATILVGPSQRVAITSDPSGAHALILPEGVDILTPGEAKLARHHTHTVRFQREGYQTTMGYLDYQPGGAVFANILLGGVFGILVDQSTGAAYTLEPDPLHVTLTPIAPAAPAPAATP